MKASPAQATEESAGSQSRSYPLFPLAALLVAMVTVQSGGSLAKTLLPQIGAEGATALRLGLAAGILLALFRPWRTRLDRATWRPLLLYGVAMGSMNLLFYLALRRLPLAVAVALEFTGPLGLALWHSRRRVDLCWVALAFTGIALLFPHGATNADIDRKGVAFALAGGTCWAIYIVTGKQATAQGHQTTVVAWGTLIAALLTLPIGIGFAGEHLLSLRILPLALAVALTTSVIPYTLEMVALAGLSTRAFGILTSLEPALAALSAAIILGERLSFGQGVAIAAIMAASAGAIASDTRRPAPEVRHPPPD